MVENHGFQPWRPDQLTPIEELEEEDRLRVQNELDKQATTEQNPS